MEMLRATIAEMLPDNSLGEEDFSLLSLKNNESWKYKKWQMCQHWVEAERRSWRCYAGVKKLHFPPTL